MLQLLGIETRGKIKLSEAVGEPSDEVRQKVDEWYDGLPPGRQAVVSGFEEGLRAAAGEDPTIHYRLSERVKQPWNMLVGAQLAALTEFAVQAPNVLFVGGDAHLHHEPMMNAISMRHRPVLGAARGLYAAPAAGPMALRKSASSAGRLRELKASRSITSTVWSS